ncbi:hypothetical protein FK220_006885 [Flavobacteriaceae bacterium TP-CH-4]|uniref:Uncharacterized protein n=1 Tax=Pelagihabitans pacificus TaxID=2696054 RepID=A0A967E545_9FLAO|nr:hypothetical protein [Pelagihabitans pacificus]NHF59057.1 hypothetical protein [Pelagihabitans pacificus]
MRHSLFLVSLFVLFHSCIPLRIAPTIEDYKVTRGKKFKRGLSKRQMFIFEDPKDAGHFYEYVNTKFQLNDTNVYDDIPFKINEEQYFFAWYEIEIADKTLNLAPAMFDIVLNGALGNEEFEPYLMESANNFSRKGHWYIAIEVYSDSENDCLSLNALSREAVLNYLSALKKEYLSTHNYNEVVFKN